MNVLAVYNFKGGVGKTTTAVNLAWLAAKQGHRTLLWDLDAQGGATFLIDAQPGLEGGAKKLLKDKDALIDRIIPSPYAGLDILPSDLSLRHLDRRLAGDDDDRRIVKMLKPLSEVYDWVILDAPPSLSDLAEQIFRASQALLVPLLPTPLSVLAYGQLRAYLAREKTPKPRLMPFLSMVDARKKLHKDMIEGLPAKEPDLLKTHIPYSSAVERVAVQQAPLGVSAAGSKPAAAFLALWREVEGKFAS